MSTSLVICSQKVYNVQINNISRTFLSLQLLFINYNVSSCNVVFPQMIVFHCKKEGVLSCFLNSTRLSFLFTQKIWKSKYNRILNIIRGKLRWIQFHVITDEVWASKAYFKSKQGLILWPLICKIVFQITIFNSSICLCWQKTAFNFIPLFVSFEWVIIFVFLVPSILSTTFMFVKTL